MIFPPARVPFLAWWLTGLIAISAGNGCQQDPEAAPAPPTRSGKAFHVDGGASGELTFPGIVEPGERAVLSFGVPGRLVELPVKAGRDVQKGQLIGHLDPKHFQIAVNEARARYEVAEADVKRYQALYERDAVSPAEFEQRRSQRDMAAARLEEARMDLGDAYLRAPFSGRIGRRYVENFTDVQAGQAVVELDDLSSVEILIDVTGDLVERLRPEANARAFAVFEAASGRRFPLSLKEMGTRAAPATHAFRVTYQMPQPEDFVLLPGMTAEVQIVLPLAGEASSPEAAGINRHRRANRPDGEGLRPGPRPGGMEGLQAEGPRRGAIRLGAR